MNKSMFGFSRLSTSHLFLFLFFLLSAPAGLAEILLTHGQVNGSKQYHASAAHLAWLSQHPAGAGAGLLPVLELELEGVRDCPDPDEVPPLPLLFPPLFLWLVDDLTAATSGVSVFPATEIAATPADMSVALVLRKMVSAAWKTWLYVV